jgi:hypothetical protein
MSMATQILVGTCLLSVCAHLHVAVVVVILPVFPRLASFGEQVHRVELLQVDLLIQPLPPLVYPRPG